MVELPFRNTWNISLNCTVLPYKDALGEDYACQTCPGLWSWGGSESNKERVWDHLTGQCHCYSSCFSSLSAPGHHNSSHRLAAVAQNYATSSSTYDVVGIFTGHKICAGTTNHGYVGGSGYLGGSGFVGVGHDDVYAYDSQSKTWYVADSTPNLLNNIMSNIALMQHEFSHNYGLYDGNHDFTDENNCNMNMPCVMSGGFGGIVYAENIWCEHCRTKFAYSSKGHLLGGE